MVSLDIQNPFIEYKINTECKGDLENFLNKVSSFFENEEKEMAKAYEKGKLSTAQIAKQLGITRLDVLELLDKYNIYYGDYDLNEEKERIAKFESKLKVKV